ncbi:phytanoyl-CoA dioxygenase family protein [Aquimarina sp. 2201CG5-10]|uniref:phytanoyl-CoA dioxygenase family protein n=1 Tax=Aquimarina callyspongiae TaxID=3098150 RepID=UPI002AB41A60|nr:phytanoyl-CoA dioxygenase family protein [Aquimarina sp. 2201CG5-10]MDY8137027.1 phytanoyl-CoA dioxygenase family protein [Aquimarina sp. 2201CG5-10]
MMKKEFLKNGFIKLDALIPFSEVEKIRVLYDELLNDEQRTEGLRSDLSGQSKTQDTVEKITQIMRPSMIEPKLLESIAYKFALNHAKKMLGDDMALDFDMLINKAPYTDTPTPWHQDAAYWIKMPDKRSVSCWIALDDVYENNGCMWFIHRKEKIIKPHSLYSKGGALHCKTDTSEAQCIPIQAGGCTFHDGFTLHFSKGNTTSSQRRALILNFRPKEMIELERKQGIDHTGTRKVRNKDA